MSRRSVLNNLCGVLLLTTFIVYLHLIGMFVRISIREEQIFLKFICLTSICPSVFPPLSPKYYKLHHQRTQVYRFLYLHLYMWEMYPPLRVSKPKTFFFYKVSRSRLVVSDPRVSSSIRLHRGVYRGDYAPSSGLCWTYRTGPYGLGSELGVRQDPVGKEKEEQLYGKLLGHVRKVKT